ncbi:TonB-dependent receptor domain-containing protein [Methylotenera versatilis]|uniref:TonB-dependent receptor domain-containing protein n=1 Tax=Methylotenera versatilis TaxID=1055487 RepID=UPI0006464947|nr:TonB-dependent receptor [Methylotenera versatilis]
MARLVNQTFRFGTRDFAKKSQNIISLSIMLMMAQASHSYAAELVKTIPPQSFNIPAGDLTKALSEYSATAGVLLSFDSELTHNKTTQGLKGQYTVKDGFTTLLKDSGLEIINNKKGELELRKAPAVKVSDSTSTNVELKEVKVRAKRFKQVGPMPGLDLTKEQIAGNIQSITAKEIKEAHSLSLADLLNSKLQSVNVNDYQGNPFQMDVTYRGFTASPQIGSPQGLSVFFDGIRVNEPFGDVVNWDMIPMNALGGFDLIPGSNPLYGLNTLGGALTMKTKSGFTDAGVSAEVLTGSFGRKQLQASGGWNNAIKEEGSWDTAGDYAAFGAINVFMEDGWRDNSPSKVNQAFGKLEWQGERASLAFSTLGVVNKLTGNGTVPQELYREDPSAVFTSPDVTKNKLIQFQIAGAFDVNDTVNVTGMVYHRQSNRRSSTGDIIPREEFENSNFDGPYRAEQTRKALPGEDFTCNLLDSNAKGFPDYYVADEATYNDFSSTVFDGLNNNTYTPPLGFIKNAPIPIELQQELQRKFSSPGAGSFSNSIDVPSLSFSATTLDFVKGVSPGNGQPASYVDGGNRFYIFAAPATNATRCPTTGGISQVTGQLVANDFGLPSTGKSRNGFFDGGTGVIEGTPTAVITESDIQQTTKGATVQLNFNLDQHKAMVGAAIDQAKASYDGSQSYGLLDNNRNVYSAPDQIGEEFYARNHDVPINKFKGTSMTKSIYASETWSPTQTLNLSASARYNYTDIKNKLAPKISESGLNKLLNKVLFYQTCTTAGCTYDSTKPIDALAYRQETVANLNLTDIEKARVAGLLDVPAIEKFSYHSLNPAFGATWQAKPNLNLYANWNQGTRVPSVIELGCAYDGTLVPSVIAPDGTPQPPFKPRSILENRGCSLPSALSGDPYLPQVKAQTMEIGARGKFGDFMEWNISAYRTDLRDDIYMTSLTPELNFFQSIGDTRRQGLEFGIAGEYGKSDFRINYSLTDATFQSKFQTISPNNSSRTLDPGSPNYNMIEVKPGNVLPGIPFNNLNFNWGYKVTRDFKVNLGVVAHSGSFLRGNENNAHTPSQGRVVTVSGAGGAQVKLPDNQYDGTAPGYAVVNLSSRYNMGKGWALNARINNLLDKQYYTAGRLGINPIAPSTFGAIGPGGFNYNSSEWIPSQFISAGAPRGIWLSVAYDFDASKKALPNSALVTEPNLSDLETPTNIPNAEEVALAQQLDKIKALPVINRTQISTQVAEQEVTNSVEAWRKAQVNNKADSYIASYTSDFTPVGVNRADWVETTKLAFLTEATTNTQLNDVVVMPEGKRMVAVFNQTLSRGEQIESVRKVLTFELKGGQWKITQEHALATKQIEANSSAKAKLPDASSLSQTKPKASRLNTASNQEVK